MSDEPELHVGTAPVPDSVMLSWRRAVELVFAEGDFRARPRSRADRPVREVWDYYHDEDPAELLYLISSAEAVRARLRIQGYTSAYCEAVWYETRDELASRWRRQLERGEMRTTGPDISEMEAISYEGWLEMVRERHIEGPASRSAGRHQPWQAINLLRSISDPIVSLHLLLDALGGPVWLDCATLFDFELNSSLTPHELLRRETEREGEWSGGRIIVLTEGRSDTRIISAALRALHPGLADAYQFLDFDEFRIEGGASPLARMVKVLSGARMGNRMLALFDNDAAGVEAMRSVSRLRLPRTVRLMALPDIASARRYPTIGPGGRSRMDVNGAAASIELYLGRGALTDTDGALLPVRWTEWRPQVGRYQGAVEGKDRVVAAFLSELSAEPRPGALRRRFPDMDRLLRAIFAAFEDLPPPIL